jgi:hypothetical protein
VGREYKGVSKMNNYEKSKTVQKRKICWPGKRRFPPRENKN